MKTFATKWIVVIQLAIGTVLLAIVVRTWLLMGLLVPVTVAGSSMAPTLLGPHVSVQCKRCQHTFDVGAEFAVEADEAECPQCGYLENPLVELPLLPGSRLVIDRTAFAFRLPQRWEPVVFVSPADDGGLVVKRVVGLPGETIQLRDGEVWIDGKMARKSLTTQRNLRSLVHLETSAANRWQGEGWAWKDEAWNSTSGPDWQWLSYGHPEEKSITDDMSYNAGLTRRLFVVRDMSLSTKLHSTGNGELAIRFREEGQEYEVRLQPTAGKLELSSNGKLVTQKDLSVVARSAMRDGEVQLEIFSCGQQVSVAIDGRMEFIHKVKKGTKKGTGVVKKDSRPLFSPPLFSLGARGLSVTLKDLCIYRAPYCMSREELLSFKKPMTPFTLGEQEIYVLGDNTAVSLDSRDWGSLPLRFLVGRPLGVR